MPRIEKLLTAIALIATCSATALAQQPADVACPVPGESCKVLLLTDAEVQILTQQNGVLDTARQARSLDLGNIAAHFIQRIAAAPAGKVVPKPETPAAKVGEAHDALKK